MGIYLKNRFLNNIAKVETVELGKFLKGRKLNRHLVETLWTFYYQTVFNMMLVIYLTLAIFFPFDVHKHYYQKSMHVNGSF